MKLLLRSSIWLLGWHIETARCQGHGIISMSENNIIISKKTRKYLSKAMMKAWLKLRRFLLKDERVIFHRIVCFWPDLEASVISLNLLLCVWPAENLSINIVKPALNRSPVQYFRRCFIVNGKVFFTVIYAICKEDLYDISEISESMHRLANFETLMILAITDTDICWVMANDMRVSGMPRYENLRYLF